tara:strand:+ start:2298 stop:2543 length:246 start_codon:yes stop_codon:yes gene_type:complete
MSSAHGGWARKSHQLRQFDRPAGGKDMRYNEQAVQPEKESKKKKSEKKEKPREMDKPGSYTTESLKPLKSPPLMGSNPWSV